MEKNIASHDLSDMMMYEGMYARSKRFYFKQKFAYLKKIVQMAYSFVEHLIRSIKQFGGRIGQRSSLLAKQPSLTSTAVAFYSVFAASVLISFFWFTLLLSATP